MPNYDHTDKSFCAQDCACLSCMAKCDAEAASGRIPLNASWWMVQQVFAVEMPRVDGFFAEVSR